MAIQLAARAGARVFTTAGTAAKLDVCRELGADVASTTARRTSSSGCSEETDGAGVDVVLDNMGAKYLMRNVDALAVGGRLVSIGMQGGTKAEIDLGALMRKRASVHATTLRSRPATGPGGKAEIVAAVLHDVWPDVERGVVRPSWTGGCRCPGSPRRTAWSRRASTSARCCCSTRAEPGQSGTRTSSLSPSPSRTTSATAGLDVRPSPPRPVPGLRDRPSRRSDALPVAVDREQVARLARAACRSRRPPRRCSRTPTAR